MSDEVRAAVEKTAAQFREIFIESNRTQWDAATTGTPEALDAAAKAEAAWLRFWADPEAYERYRKWDEEGAAGDDPLLKRAVHILHLQYADGQRDPATIDEMSELSTALTDAYTNFRADVNGERLTANAIHKILADETNSERRRAAWEASKEIGPLVADKIRRLAELRNQAARNMGYDNFHRMSLTLNELDPDWLYGLLDELAQKTEQPFLQAKAAMDAELAERFNLSPDELMPWHYADTFFQEAPMVGGMDFNKLFEGRDLVDLAVATYDGLGMDVRPILARSDLYEREGKDQHAFCTHIDREGDVRILCNLQPTLRWMDTLLHELGHGVYDAYIPQSLPWILREVSHILTTEAMAMLMGTMPFDRDWQEQVLGASPEDAQRAAEDGARRFRLEELIFARWVMVVVNFERALYADPSQDLNALWWELVHKFQHLRVPDGREQRPDWATKYHIALAPAYYQNYLLGRMMSLQWDHWLRQNVGGIVVRAEAGDFFRQRIFEPGNTMPWNEQLVAATGEGLNPDYFVEKFA